MKTTEDKIEEKFNRSQDALVLQQSDLSLKSISDMVESGAIDISPKYQRRPRWTEQKESDLIESFILNIPVPPIYLAEDAYGTYSVIDGKQRITAINKFLKGELSLKNPERFPELDATKFIDLPTSIRNALKIRPYLRVVTLLKQSDSELKHEVFIRLNKAGVALNSQEIRNVAFRGPLNDAIFELSEDNYFRSRLKSHPKTAMYKEMKDVQYVLRFFTVKEYWNSFPGSMDKAMDQFMSANYRKKTSEVSKYKDQFLRALDACKKIWGEQAFQKPGGSQRVLQGYYDVQMVCLSLLSDSKLKTAIGSAESVRHALEDIMNEDDDFYGALTQFTSNPARVRYRISVFNKTLKEIL